MNKTNSTVNKRYITLDEFYESTDEDGMFCIAFYYYYINYFYYYYYYHK